MADYKPEAPGLDNIQGDIWPGLAKKYQHFWFFQITDASVFKPSLGKLVADGVITSSEDALNHRKDIHKTKTEKPGELHHFAAVNISFSARGMKKLSKDGFRDDPFLKGMEEDMANQGRDKIEDWIDGFKEANGGVDGVVLVCGTEPKVKETTDELAQKYFSANQGVKHVLTLDGRERPGENAKHEHFGYLDAISQPRLEGFDKKNEKGDGNYQAMCRPGRIIIGRNGDMENVQANQHPDWAKDGSYFVFRKLRQFVPEFNNYLETEGPKLGFTGDQLGARLVGRWKSGAPVQLHPDKDCPEDAQLNEFNYPLNDQTRCPFASHMRKTKPRSIVVDRDMNDIMRRGIPYGPEVGPDETKTKQDRGLMFTCYQSSISNGFHFLKANWINLDTFPADKTEATGGVNPGQDAVVGQLVKRPKRAADKKLTTSLVDGKGQHTTTSYAPFIQSNGGDYFFSPSLSLLRGIGGLPQPGKGKRKRSDSSGSGPSIAYRGKFDYTTDSGTRWASNENIWAIFPKGQADGVPLYILASFSKDNKGTEKKPFNFHFKTIRVDSGSNAFTTKEADVDGSGPYYFFDYFDGKWSEDGKTLELTLRDVSGNEGGTYTLARSDSAFKDE